MSGYIIEEENESPIFVNSNGDEIIEYWRLYSKHQEKRFKKVLQQLNKTWYSVYNEIKFMRDYGNISLDNSNNIMYKVHRLFIIKHKQEVDYYNEEKLRQRRNKTYLSKKINKLKHSKNKI